MLTSLTLNGLISVAALLNAAQPPASSSWPVVTCQAQTPVVGDDGDAADDAAVWVHPSDGAKSLVIGTNKRRGLHVYDLDGAELQQLSIGRPNNVDVISELNLVFASNRAGDVVSVLRVDPNTRRLTEAGAFSTGLTEVYGLCAYIDPASGAGRVVVNSKFGTLRIFGLPAVIPSTGPACGENTPELLREIHVGTQIEGVVADAERGFLYVGEECVGVWRYPIDPATEPARTLLDVVGDNGPVQGRLARDVEGITLYRVNEREGYLIVSCQGQDRFAVYDRGSNAYLGSFTLTYRPGTSEADRVTHTDGIEVSNRPLGPKYPAGIFIAQDDADGGRQSFKFASWADIARAFSPPLKVAASPSTSQR